MKTAALSILLLCAIPQIAADDAAADEANDDEMPIDTLDDDTAVSGPTDYGNSTLFNSTFFNETNATTAAPTPAPEPCDYLLEFVHQEIYDDDVTIQTSNHIRPGESACSCIQSSFDGNYYVTCNLDYCEECDEETGVCLSRSDRYLFGNTPDLDNPEVASYQQRLDFDPILEQTDEDGTLYNWTGVNIVFEGDDCTAVVYENFVPFEDDDKTGSCACEYVECENGDTQLAFDCGNGKKWGYCEKKGFEPNTLSEDDPLKALNTEKYSWAACFDDPTEEDIFNATNATYAAINATNATEIEEEEEEEVETQIEKKGPTSRGQPKGGVEANSKPQGADKVEEMSNVENSEPLTDMFTSSSSIMRNGQILMTLLLATGAML